MPGPAAHLVIIDEQTKRVLADPSTFNGPLSEALDKHRAEAALGAIGPDMVFWADWNIYTPVVNTIFDIYKTLDEIYEALMAIWQPIQDHIDKVLDAVSGGVVAELQETITIIEGIIKTAILRLITENVPILDELKPHLQDNGAASSETAWNWLDYMHHRWTGEFNTELIRRAHASGRADLRAYAYGWLSHVTADVVGHAYVNTAVGGPWRSHWHRHFIQEKFMDSWVWGFYKGNTTMPTSVAPGTIPFSYETWPNINGASLHNLVDVGDNMPGHLQDLIVDSLEAVYQGRPHPNVGGMIPFLGRQHINRAYQMLVEALEIMTSKDRAIPPPQPPTVMNDDGPPGYPVPSSGGGGGGGGGSFSLLGLLLAILELIKSLFEYVHDLVLWLVSQVTYPLTYPIRYAFYLLQLSLYEIYRQYRWALALTGFAYPDPDQLYHPLAQQFINPLVNVMRMPRREFPPEMENALMFPSGCSTPQPQPVGCIEPVAANSGPYTRWPLNYPYWFIEGEPLNPAVVNALSSATLPQDTIAITSGLFPPPAAGIAGAAYAGSLGNALDFFLRYARTIARAGGDANTLNLPDWNLDADRGYGFKCWRVTGGLLEPPPETGVVATYNV